MKKLIALILAMVMILSLGATASALELGDLIYLRVDIEGVEVTTAAMAFEGVDGGLNLQKNSSGLYFNRYYAEELAGAFVLTVDYVPAEGGDMIREVSDPMYLADIDGIIVLDEAGFHLENSYPVNEFGEDGDYQKDVTVYGTYEGEEDAASVICVDIEWGSMDFVYTPVEEWNPVTHTYEPVEGIEGTWALAEGKNNGVRVVNHSNADVDVSFSFNDSQDLGITGVFTTDSEGTGDVVTGFTLLSADLEFAAGNYEAADNNAVFLQIIGGAIPADMTDQRVIGHITVTVAVSAEQTA